MKKLQWMTLLGLVVTVFAFVACGDDDDDDDTANGGLKGTWTYANTLTDSESQTRHGIDVTLTFTDNTYEMKVIQHHDDKLSGDFRENFGEGERGTYTYSGTTLRLQPTGINFYESIDGRAAGWSEWEPNARDAYTVQAAISGKRLTVTHSGQEWYWMSWGESENSLTLTRK